MDNPVNVPAWIDAITNETSSGNHKQIELSEYERYEVILYLGAHREELDGSAEPKHVKAIADIIRRHRVSVGVQLNS